MELIKPKALKPGDTLAVVSPSSPIEREKYEAGAKLLESYSYKLKPFPHVFDKDFYLAGTDADRASDLQTAFADPECQAVLCSRGGYGCSHLIPLLDFDQMVSSKKMFIGFSDITLLHLALNRRGLVTMHAPMLLTLAYDRKPWVIESFFNMLRGKEPIPNEAPTGLTLVPGVAEGAVTGGCLCLLSDSLGTSEPIDATGKILLIEDTNEYPYRVDAMLTHLCQTGTLQSAAGIVIGEMSGTDEKTDPTIPNKSWYGVVQDIVRPLGVPTVTHFPFGHMKTMLSLPLGIRARLDADAGTLTYLESACATL